MKRLFILLVFFYLGQVDAQPVLPFYYEQNLPLNGRPNKISEYYYEYHTQAKAHYYDHFLQYDAQGKVKSHVKTNKDLLHPDSIPLTFKDIIDPRAVTIAYSFEYDNHNRLIYFRKKQSQDEVGSFQQDEEWKYDQQGMLVAHLFTTIENGDTVLKNPSSRRTIYRDGTNKVLKIEKFTYFFANKGLVLNEVTEFGYRSRILDTITSYRILDGEKTLVSKKYAILFNKYVPLNTDSLLFESYLEDIFDRITKHTFRYDDAQRMTESITQSDNGDTLSYSTWTFEALKTTENTDDHITETFFDETGYERYEEEFEGGYSLATPADLNTRKLEDGKMKHALLEIWDPVTRFYRKDTEYFFYYDQTTGTETEMSAKNEFQVYPNPSFGTLFLKNWNELTRLDLISVDGLTFSLPIQPVLQLNVPKGLYLLQALFADGSSKQTKIVIK